MDTSEIFTTIFFFYVYPMFLCINNIQIRSGMYVSTEKEIDGGAFLSMRLYYAVSNLLISN